MMTDDIERDFAGPPLTDVVRGYLVRGASRATLAEILGVALDEADAIVAEVAHDAGFADAATWLLSETLDEITRLAFLSLDDHTETRAPLLAVVLNVARLRHELAHP